MLVVGLGGACTPALAQGEVPASFAKRPSRKPGPFVHPGALHTKEDFARMAAKVKAKEEPWFGSWEALAKSPHGLRHPIRPVEQIIRGITGKNNYTGAQKDAATLYQCALRYRITGDEAQGRRALEFLNRWSATMKKPVGGNSNYALGAGIVGYQFACAAEMMRDHPEWRQEEFAACKEMMKLFLEGNRGFLRGHNGTCGTHYRLNWDTCNMASMLAIGVFLDDGEVFNEALEYFFDGVGNGCIERSAGYVFANGLGQPEEMGRDQPHNMTGLHFLAIFCEIAWNQGIDLYGYDNNRFLRAVECATKYNLGHDDVPYVAHRTCTLNYTEGTISEHGRGALPPMFEMIYHHYANRRGIAAPYVKEAMEKIHPERGPQPNGHPSGYDFLGNGTLAYSRDPIKVDAPPSGLRAFWSGRQVTLSWWGSAYATGYKVLRAERSGGPYQTIGTAAPKDASFIDKKVANGSTYFYAILADGLEGRKGKQSAEVEVRQKLVTQYAFEGDVKDSAGQNHAAPSGIARFQSIQGNGKATEFDGEKDYLTLPSGIANHQDITIAAWVYWEGGKDWQRVFDFGGDITKNMFLTPKGKGKMRFEMTTSRGNEGTGRLEAPGLQTRRWTHVAVTLDGDTGTLYVDGEPVSSAPITIDPFFTQNRCYIGKSQHKDPFFKGRIDDFRIYNHALPAAAVREVFQRRE